MTGKSISHYSILEKLGEGGMGIVYKAEDSRLRRAVALKFLPSHLAASDQDKERFLREAQASAALNHPNICTIYGIEEDTGQLFIVMELIDGTTLGKKLPVVNADDAVSYAIQIGEALHEAHSKGIVHRDIKTDNIMVNAKGQIKVMDFGLAKLRGSVKLTRTSSTVGTLAYMAPEQLQGGEIDARSDIFSFGVVLYEMFTAHLPFRGEHEAAMMYSILNEEPEPVQNYRPELPPDAVYVISKAMEKNPEDRYQTVSEMLVDLRRLRRQTTRVTHSREHSLPSPEPPLRLSGTHPSIPGSSGGGNKMRATVITLGIILTGVLVYGLVIYFTKPKSAGVVQMSFTQLTDEPGIEYNPDISPDGNYIVYEKGNENGPNMIFLKRIGGENAINLTPNTKVDDTQPAISPDGQEIAFVRWGSEQGIFLMGATGENIRRLSDFGYNPSWSPDGREIVCSTMAFLDPNMRSGIGSELWQITVATGEKRKIGTGDAMEPQWSPHGFRIAFWGVHAGGQRDIWTVPVSGGDPVAVTDDAYVDWDPVWSPDGKYLYFSSDRGGSMNLWRIAIDEQTGRVLGEPQPVTTPASYSGYLRISRDGRRVVYVAIDQRSNVYEVGLDPDKGACTGTPHAVTQGTRIYADFSLSSNGEWIALTTGGTQEDVCVMRRDGTELRQLTNDVYKDRTPFWLPDGRRIAFMSDRSGNYELWCINADGGNLEQLTKDTPRGFFIEPILSMPGGNMLLCASDSGLVTVDLSKPPGSRTEQKYQFPANGSDVFLATSVSPDSQYLAGGSRSGVVIYSLATKTYESITDSGSQPHWLMDNQRLIYVRHGKLFIVDRRTKITRELENQPAISNPYYQISPDGRTLYYTVETKEADIWQLTMKEPQ